MKKVSFRCYLLCASILSLPGAALAQPAAEDQSLHIVKSSINADSENAELCLEFDKPLTTSAAARLAAAVRLQEDGKDTAPQNIVPTSSSLCLFPLDRGHAYRATLNNTRGPLAERMATAYSYTFTIPDRSPTLAFTGSDGGINNFGTYDTPLTLRAVNVSHASIEIFRITDGASMPHIWQDRAQTALAPSESAYLAHDKGQSVWKTESTFDAVPNTTFEQKIALQEQLPDLAPGLYLIIADAGGQTRPANKGLAPLAAAWFTKSDFALHAIRDGSGVHILASTSTTPKGNLHLAAFNHKMEQVAETQSASDGTGFMPDAADAGTIIGTDQAGNIGFADIMALPPLASAPMLGSIFIEDPIAIPGEAVAVSVSLTAADAADDNTQSTFLRIMRDQSVYTDVPLPSLANHRAKLSFTAPAKQGVWTLRWQKKDGTVLAETPLRVTANVDAPHLSITANGSALNSSAAPEITIAARTEGDSPAPFIAGRLMAAWQPSDPSNFGWAGYSFGVPSDDVAFPQQAASFLTDLQGTATVHADLPKAPANPGLYQLALTTLSDPDQGAADAPPLILPLRPESSVIGIKPLSPQARFSQNGIARFALISLSADNKLRDASGLSYQIYALGRSFAWYQDDGRWNYKHEPQLRPIGAGALSIKADGNTVLEWPVTAGNYRLEILDANEKILAQTTFSAGWDSTVTATPSTPLAVSLPRILQPGHETTAHFTLPAPAMVTAVIADTHIRKSIVELRPKGENSIAFTPGADWQNGVSVTIDAMETASTLLHGSVQASLAHAVKPAPIDTGVTGVALTASPNPSALVLHSGEAATVTFGIENRGEQPDTYHYALAASPDLKIESATSGTLTVGGRQSRSLPILVSGAQSGAKEIKLEITGTHAPRIIRSWPIAVLSRNSFLLSNGTPSTVMPRQALTFPPTKTHDSPTVAFIARRPVDGLAEILSYLSNAHPFTTPELALGIDALRLWGSVLGQSGLAPDFLIAAKKQEWLMQLLQRQKSSGGFTHLPNEDPENDGTIDDTAAALVALGPDASEKAQTPKTLAVEWLKQKLSNTWFDEKERAPRAAAYAGLAAADAIDVASLHYFSDINAGQKLPPIAETNIAASFKHIRDPNAAAFWIKKMLDEDKPESTIALLNALAATDALSSDDVHAALATMAASLRRGTPPGFIEAAGLLRAISADNVNAGTWSLDGNNAPRAISGVYALRLGDGAPPSLRNNNSEPLTISLAGEDKPPHFLPPVGAEITRHVYRLNGVELAAPARPERGEIYVVELAGKMSELKEDEQALIRGGAENTLHPIGCVLSNKLDTLAFLPWLAPQGLSSFDACERTAYGLSFVLPPTESDHANFRAAYFAHIDAPSIDNIDPPHIRKIK